jgi:hypothetical protein
MMSQVFSPVSSSFLADHNGAYLTNYWGSWDLLNVAGVLAIGILCDDGSLIDEAVTHIRSGAGNGSLPNAIPVVYADGTAQWMEAGRDQGHALLAVGLMGTICEMAWNQGIDLYGALDNRILRGAEYVAKFNLGQAVPYTTYSWKKGAPRGVVGHRDVHPGLPLRSGAGPPDLGGDLPPLRRTSPAGLPEREGDGRPAASRGRWWGLRPEQRGVDQLGFGTLAFTR